MTELNKFLVNAFNDPHCYELVFLRLNKKESEILEKYSANKKQDTIQTLKELIRSLVHQQYDAAKAAVVEQMSATTAKTEDEILEEAVGMTDYTSVPGKTIGTYRFAKDNNKEATMTDFENFDKEFGDAWEDAQESIDDVHRRIGLKRGAKIQIDNPNATVSLNLPDPLAAIAQQLQAISQRLDQIEAGSSSQSSVVSYQQVEKEQVESWQKCFTEEATAHLLLKLHAEVSALLMDLDLEEFKEPRFQPLAKLQSQIVSLLYFVDTASVQD